MRTNSDCQTMSGRQNKIRKYEQDIQFCDLFSSSQKFYYLIKYFLLQFISNQKIAKTAQGITV